MFTTKSQTAVSGRNTIAALTFALIAFATPANAQYAFVRVADTTTVESGGGTLTDFGPVSISGGTAVFQGFHTGGTGTVGIFTGTGTGALTTVVRGGANGVGGSAVPGGGNFSRFATPTVSNGTVAFRGDYTGGTGYTGLLTVPSSGGAFTSIVRAGLNGVGGSSVPGGTVFNGIGFGSISGDTVVFNAEYTGGANPAGVFVSRNGSLTTVARSGSGGFGGSVTPNGGTFNGFESPTVRGNKIAFNGFYSGGTGNAAIFTQTEGGALTSIARRGSVGSGGSVTPYGGTFNNFSNLSISATATAFRGNYTGGLGTVGIFVENGGTLTGIARAGTSGTGSTAPGGGTFTSLSDPSITDTAVFFRGDYSGAANGSGIFASMSGVLVPVIQRGDAAFGSTITNLDFDANGAEGNNIAFRYSLADGESGIAIASLGAVAVPEAGAGLLALLAVPALLIARRKR